MPNKIKGEVATDAGAGPVVFRLGINELIELQDDLGIEKDEDFFKVFDNLRSLKQIRAIVFRAMKHTRPDVTVEQAGDTITELGVGKVKDLIVEALKWAMPDPETTEGLGKGSATRSPGPPPS